jgi:hypothetical protein
LSKRRGRWFVDTNTGYSFHTVAVYEVDLPRQRTDYTPGSKTGIAVQ